MSFVVVVGLSGGSRVVCKFVFDDFMIHLERWEASARATADSEMYTRIVNGAMTEVYILSCDQDALRLSSIARVITH